MTQSRPGFGLHIAKIELEFREPSDLIVAQKGRMFRVSKPVAHVARSMRLSVRQVLPAHQSQKNVVGVGSIRILPRPIVQAMRMEVRVVDRVDPARMLAEAEVVLDETKLPGFGIDLIDRQILRQLLRSGVGTEQRRPEILAQQVPQGHEENLIAPHPDRRSGRAAPV
ncbi:MAG: hypothetical protein AB7U18_02565 [Dehalococcoidia bacterium]